MAKENRLGDLGNYILAGSIFFGAEAYAQENSQKIDKLNNIGPFARVTSINTESARDLTYSSHAPLDSSDVTPKDTTKSRPHHAQKRKTLQNKIYSRNHEFSTTSDGIVLKDFVYNFTLEPDSKIEISKFFDLYAKRGEIQYSVIDARKGLKNIISFLKKDLKSRDIQSQKERIATIEYYENLLNETSQNDRSSLNKLEKSLYDGIIDVQKDSLMVDSIWQIKEGEYIIISKNKKTEWYAANSVPIIVDIKTRDGKIGSKSATAVTQAPKQKDEKKDEKEVFMEENGDTLRLLKPYHKMTNEQIKEFFSRRNLFAGKKEIEIISKEGDSLWTYTRIKDVDENYVGEKKLKDSVRKEAEQDEENKAKEVLRTKFGLQAGIGTNGQKILGAFVDIPLNSWLSGESYINYYFARGNPVFTDRATEVTIRERELVGSNIYKQRTDEIITDIAERAMGEMGLGVILKAGNLEFPLRIGNVLSRKEKTLYGKSTISFERDGQLLREPNVITNSKDENPGSALNLSLSAGARFKINKNLFVGGSFNRIGQKNTGRINIGLKF